MKLLCCTGKDLLTEAAWRSHDQKVLVINVRLGVYLVD